MTVSGRPDPYGPVPLGRPAPTGAADHARRTFTCVPRTGVRAATRPADAAPMPALRTTRVRSVLALLAGLLSGAVVSTLVP